MSSIDLSSLLGTSSSSIDISSILQAAYGSSSSGLDVTSAVNSAVTAARGPETAWSNLASNLQSQVTALARIQTDATNLDTDLQSLNSLTGPLSARTVSSSNSNVLSATAASGTVSGNHVVVVNSLAATASWTSSTFSSSSATVPSGSFTITNGSGTSATITSDGTKTLSDIANQVNSSGLGLTANVITDTSGSRLAITANSSGTAGNFTVSADTSGLGLSKVVTGANASVTIDGLGISSASNTVTNAIPGLSINLLSASPGTQVSLQVAPDTTQAASAIKQFVSDYNSVISDLNSQFTFSGGSQGVLAGDSTIRNLQATVLSVLGYTATSSSGSTSIPNLSSLGITVGNDGTLTVNSSALQSSLQNHFGDVQNFFQGASLNGFASSMDQQLSGFVNSDSGAFTVDLKSMNTQITQYRTEISDFEANYITPLKARLQSQYSQAEIALQQLPSQISQINAELGTNSKN